MGSEPSVVSVMTIADYYGSAIRRAVRVGARDSRPRPACGAFGRRLFLNPIREE
jgi:hypothetical protein